jgi:IS4 transposase
LGLAFFVTRAKSNLDFGRRSSRRVDKTTGVCSDQTIVLCGPKTSKLYPDSLRRVVYRDPKTGRRLVFLSNNFDLPALTIAQIYRRRWQVELFFRWIKQHLRIKSFYGTSPNAVKTQVWIAICIYVLVAIIRKELNVEHSLHEILQILSVSLFEKTPINEALSPEKPISGEH